MTCDEGWVQLFAQFGELPMEIYSLKLTMKFQQQLAHLLVKESHFLTTLANKGLKPGINLQPCRKHHGVYLITSTTQQHQKSHLIISENHVLLKSGPLLISWGRNYLHIKDFLKYEYELYLKQLLPPPQGMIIIAYRTLKSQTCHQNWIVINQSYL